MGKTFSTGLLTNGIWQDASNNIGIGAANSSFKFQVTGTTNLTAALTGTSGAFSSSLGVNSTIRSTGQTDPASGVGMELFYRSADTSSYIQSYDRTNGAWKDVRIYGNTLYFGTQGTNNLTIASTGAATFSTTTRIGSVLYPSGNIFEAYDNDIRITAQSNANGTAGYFMRVMNGASQVSNATIRVNNTGSLLLFTGTSSDALQMTITSGGNVGIGSTTFTYATTNRTNLVLNGTTDSLFEFQNGGSARAYLYSNTDGLEINSLGSRFLQFVTNAEIRMRITSAGDVGIGNTAFSSTRLTVTGKDNSSSNYSFVANNSSNSNLFLVRNDGATTINGPYLQCNASLSVYYDGQSYITDSNPNDTGSRIVLNITGGTYNAGSDTSSKMIRFRSGNGTEIGYIIRNGGATISYVSSSDYRLKEDLKEFSGLDLISKIKTYDFKWIGSEHRDYGVIAHELKEVVPNIVSGEKDEVYEETGEMKPQGLDYGKLTPILIKAIQELKAEIEQLKQK